MWLITIANHQEVTHRDFGVLFQKSTHKSDRRWQFSGSPDSWMYKAGLWEYFFMRFWIPLLHALACDPTETQLSKLQPAGHGHHGLWTLSRVEALWAKPLPLCLQDDGTNLVQGKGQSELCIWPKLWFNKIRLPKSWCAAAVISTMEAAFLWSCVCSSCTTGEYLQSGTAVGRRWAHHWFVA